METEVLEEDDINFLAFCSRHNKSYKTPDEYEARKAKWLDSNANVKTLNSNDEGVVFDLNATADLFDNEFKAMLGGKIPTFYDSLKLSVFQDPNLGLISGKLRGSPTPIDWASSGFVSPVKNQGSCGACWAFASVGVLESMISIKNSANAGSYVAPVRLSEQQLIDCTAVTSANWALFKKNYGNNGCKSGWVSKGWDFSRE